MTALPSRLDPWALATLDALAEHIARQCGDTGHAVAARRAALLADLDQHQTRRGDTSGRERAVIRHHARQHTSTTAATATAPTTERTRT